MGIVDRLRNAMTRLTGGRRVPDTRAIGRTGDLRYVYGGGTDRSRESFLSQRIDSTPYDDLDVARWYPVARDALLAKMSPIVRGDVSFACANQLAADTAAQLFGGQLPALVEKLLKGGMWFGHQAVEIDWSPMFDVAITSTQADDGDAEHTFSYLWGVDSFRAFDPIRTRIMIDRTTGEFDGVRQFYGDRPYIMRPKALLYTHNKEFEGNYGVSDLKAAVPWVRGAYEILDSLIRYKGRQADPLAVVRFPEGFSQDSSGNRVSNIEIAQAIVAHLDGGAKVVIPSTPHTENGQLSSTPQWDVQFQEVPQAAADFVSDIEMFNTLIRLGIAGVPEMASSSSPDTGTYNLGEVQIRQFTENLQSIADAVDEAINEYLLKPWTIFNFGADCPPVRLKRERMTTNVAQMVLAALIQGLSTGMPLQDADGNEIYIDVAKVAQDSGLPTRVRKVGPLRALRDVLAAHSNPAGEESDA